jgi:hypothetical protein
MANTLRFKSPLFIIAQFYLDSDLDKTIGENRLLEWIYSIMEQNRFTATMVNKYEKIKINNHVADLPCDLINVVQVKYGDTFLRKTNLPTTLLHLGEIDKTKFTHLIPLDSYTVSNDKLFISYEKGEIDLFYLGFHLDEHGLPLVPDHALFVEACIEYFTYKLKYAEYMKTKGASPELYKFHHAEYRKKILKFISTITMPSPDEIVAIGNAYNRLLPTIGQSIFGYANSTDLRQDFNTFNKGVV